MGLDSVEIVMEVENTFGIRIPDKDVEKILTVGDFHNLVWEYVKDSKSAKCKSQSLFYKLRKSLNETIQIPKEKINPATMLSDIIPKDNRRELWFNLSSKQLEFPELVLTSLYSHQRQYMAVVRNNHKELKFLSLLLLMLNQKISAA